MIVKLAPAGEANLKKLLTQGVIWTCFKFNNNNKKESKI
jgi:hypothetical protein